MRTFVYDSGALVAVDRRQFDAVRRHQDRIRHGHRIVIPAPVAAQVVRDPPRQARLMRALGGGDVVPFERGDVSLVGRLLAKAGTADVLDGFVAITAARSGDATAVVTSDGDDIRHLLGTLGVRVPVLAP
jgi:hypothetical protein